MDTALASVHGGLRRKDSWSALLDRMECMTVDNFVLERVRTLLWVGWRCVGGTSLVRVLGTVGVDPPALSPLVTTAPPHHTKHR